MQISEPGYMMGNHTTSDDISRMLEEMGESLHKLTDRVNELESNQVHVHQYEMGGVLTGEPLVIGEDIQGREVWKPLS